MTLGELREIIDELLQHEGIDDDFIFNLEYNGYPLQSKSVTVVVSSDLWETGSVVMTAGDFDGEADDG